MTECRLTTGQLNLSKTSVLIVGCGGLGCPLALYLAAAGIGRFLTFIENGHSYVTHCLIFTFEWWRTIKGTNQHRSHTFWTNCLRIMVWCLLKKLTGIYNVTGRLGLLDYDEVELNNLHRQVLHGEENLGQSKALSAAHAVRRYLLLLVAFIHIHKCLYCISMCLNKGMYWVMVCLSSAG